MVAGKPEPPLFEETLRRVGGERPLVVGDRLDTDIEGAEPAGYDSLLVMTGVTGSRELVSAAPGAAADVRRGGPRRAGPQPQPDAAAGGDGGSSSAAGGPRASSDGGGCGSSGEGDAGRLVAGGRRGGLASTSTRRRARRTSSGLPTAGVAWQAPTARAADAGRTTRRDRAGAPSRDPST